jgi:hypothetical protein
MPGQALLRLVSRNGQKTTLRLSSSSHSGEEITVFTTALVDRVARVAPQTSLHLGPSQRQWIAARVGMILSGLILIATVWTLATGGPVGPLLLPIGIALVNLAIFVPILKAGRPREHVVSKASATGL